MYKGKLQELCQRRSWNLPDYTTTKDGPDHMPRFMAYVNVHGEVFETPARCKSAKEAQNTAARIAFDHFNVSPPPPPHLQYGPSSSSASASASAGVNPVTGAVPSASASAGVNPVIGAVPSISASASAPAPAGVNPAFGVVQLAAPLPTVPTDAAVAPLLPLSPLPSSLPFPPPGLLVANNDVNIEPSNGEVLLQKNCEDTTEDSMVHRMAIGSHDKSYKDTLHMYKNRLQQYAQKNNLGFPVYTCEAEGPPHARRFKSRVSLDGKSYETLEFFPTLKEAEQAAAKVACQVLSVDVIQEDGGLYKNLLQEFAQKKGLLCPSYETVSSGLSHRPLFVSTVEIGSDTFRGVEAKTKKQAEMNAAKVAYCALTESCPATESSRVSSINGCAVADNLTQNIQPTLTIKEHQDSTDEVDYTPEAQIHAKRAKSSPENMNVSVHQPGPSLGNSSSDDSNLLSSQVEISTSDEPVIEQPLEAQPSPHRKTVVFARKSSMPIPEGASVVPYSDDNWSGYKVEPDQQPTA